MDKNNFISVIICTYNRCESLKDTLDSLLNQECDGSFDYEVIVVDNNSNDRTKQVVKSYMSKFIGRLKYLFEPRQGKSYALNTGIKETKGETIAFTDDDCIVDKRWLWQIQEEFKKHPDIMLMGGRVEMFDKTKLPIATKVTKEKIVFLYPSNPWRVGFGNNLVVRKNYLLNNKLYFTYNSLTGEDIDLIYRFLRSGCKVMYSPEILVFHNHLRTGRAEILKRKFVYAISGGRFFRRYVLKRDFFALKLLFWRLLWIKSLFLQAFKNKNSTKLLEGLINLTGLIIGCLIW